MSHAVAIRSMRGSEPDDRLVDMIVHSNLKEFDEYSIVDIPVVPDAHVIVSAQHDAQLGRSF